MTEVVAMITLLGVIVTAVSTVFGIILKIMSTRIAEIEEESERVMGYNRRLWNWAREHLDLYYRHRKEGAPNPAPIPHE